jgi:hypothetical protein
MKRRGTEWQLRVKTDATRMSVSRPKLSWTKETETARQWPMPSDDKAGGHVGGGAGALHIGDAGSEALGRVKGISIGCRCWVPHIGELIGAAQRWHAFAADPQRRMRLLHGLGVEEQVGELHVLATVAGSLVHHFRLRLRCPSAAPSKARRWRLCALRRDPRREPRSAAAHAEQEPGAGDLRRAADQRGPCVRRRSRR